MAIVTCVLGKYHLHYTGEQEESAHDSDNHLLSIPNTTTTNNTTATATTTTDIKNAPEWLTWFMIVIVVLLFISWLLSFCVIQTMKRKDDPSVEFEMNMAHHADDYNDYGNGDGDGEGYGDGDGEGDLEQFKHNFDLENHNLHFNNFNNYINYSDQSYQGSSSTNTNTNMNMTMNMNMNTHVTPADTTRFHPVTNIVDGRVRYERDVF
ncbi:unnamed protein product [Ambrosiozyma monospora]|uniref:Unnamed protein product n=1 Tax=Ambrosiozyma monospora TaxID=43982 RepID=A0A9W7DJP0_AMBMO|nr:unnamed protein product [Ambrosiozyma monospora]